MRAEDDQRREGVSFLRHVDDIDTHGSQFVERTVCHVAESVTERQHNHVGSVRLIVQVAGQLAGILLSPMSVEEFVLLYTTRLLHATFFPGENCLHGYTYADTK